MKLKSARHSIAQVYNVSPGCVLSRSSSDIYDIIPDLRCREFSFSEITLKCAIHGIDVFMYEREVNEIPDILMEDRSLFKKIV